MNWIEVDSSVLRRIRWEERTDTLAVEFQTGRVYRYFGLTRFVFEALRRARSHGKYFNENIRDRFRFEEQS